MRPLILALSLLLGVAVQGLEPCRIEIIEPATGWVVPGVELRTVHGVRFVSDNAGVIACDLPELMGQETWFDIIGHGYEVKKDGFGYRGVRLRPQPGAKLQVPVSRIYPAQRLGRLTGSGLFAESQKLGEHLNWHDGSILGCDSIVTATFHQQQFWFWGDTNLAHYPLGIFNVSGATTENFQPPARPPLSVPYHYFTSPKTQNVPVA